jgi:anti-sigma B factor antagonist
MNFTRFDDGDEAVLRIEGELDAVTAPEIRPAIEKLVGDRRTRVTVDLSALRLIDSSGVGVLVSLYKRVRALGGDVRIIGVTDQPRAIFRLLRLDAVFAPV